MSRVIIPLCLLIRMLFNSCAISYEFLLAYVYGLFIKSVLVGPCHHGMARPQVADRGTSSDKEGSCE